MLSIIYCNIIVHHVQSPLPNYVACIVPVFMHSLNFKQFFLNAKQVVRHYYMWHIIFLHGQWSLLSARANPTYGLNFSFGLW
jgi:hypothetical protein